jgi:hypothetical protein
VTLGPGVAERALQTLKRLGRDSDARAIALVLRKITPGDYDPSTGDGGTPATSDYPFTGALTAYRDALVNGSTVLSSDRLCIVAADSIKVVPAVGDRVLADAVDYAVLEAPAVEVGGTPIAYRLQLRRGQAAR